MVSVIKKEVCIRQSCSLSARTVDILLFDKRNISDHSRIPIILALADVFLSSINSRRNSSKYTRSNDHRSSSSCNKCRKYLRDNCQGCYRYTGSLTQPKGSNVRLSNVLFKIDKF